MASSDKVNILIVDDQPGKLLAYEAILGELNENLVTAASGDEALQHLLKTEFAVVLLDVCMPDLDGFELARMIRQHPRCQKTAIIFVSAVQVTNLDQIKGYHHGAVDYLSVPVAPELLRARVLVFAELYRKAAALEKVNLELEQRVAERTAALQHDLARRKQLESALLDSARRKDEFLATLAHELRNPLAPIRNALHILRLSHSVEPLHQMMERQVNHMALLVDDLMEVSRISGGKIELKRQRIELAAVVNNALETVRPLIESSGHRLTVTLPPEPLLLDADPVRLTQVLTNLLNNAAKYTPAGGRIWLTVLREANRAAISVRDDGAGIPPDMLARVFEMFTQVDRTLNRAQGGLGIGLSLARILVKMHDGAIEARSDGIGQGSEFIVHLPMAKDLRNAKSRMRHKKPAAAAPAIRDPARRSPHSVLVVDDNRDAANSLGALLKLLGAEVQVAHSGAAALAALESYTPSVMLLDLGMPGMDGFELARCVRETHGAALTLIALTGWGQEEDRRRTSAAGFDHHLTKPLDLGVLQALLESLDPPAANRHSPLLFPHEDNALGEGVLSPLPQAEKGLG